MLVHEHSKKLALNAIYDACVIDIGSNSVRLVIYRLEGRSIWPVYNEKVLAGLGRTLNATGRLDELAKLETLVALRRFKAIVAAYDLKTIFTVATAAIREAEDGPEFADTIYTTTGLNVRVLTGAQEAYYAAQGVVCGHAQASGIVGDLGGSSLELIGVEQKTVTPGISLPLGPFALGAPAPINIAACQDKILHTLMPYRKDFTHKTFHAVGGAWRNLAVIWMQKANYPLQIVQQFELPAREALSICTLIAAQSPASLEKIAGVSKRRLENLSYSALVLKCLIETLGIERVCFSSNGLREGLLFDDFPIDIKARDPLIEGCAALGMRQGISRDLGPALAKWMLGFYDTVDQALIEKPEPRLIRAAAKLSDIGACLHPDHRAELIFDQVLRAPIAGQSHAERVFLACALYTRYSGDAYEREPILINRILGDESLKQATQLGLTLRLGCDLSAKSGHLLANARLERQDRYLVLSTKSGWEDLLLGEQTRKRARALAQMLKLNLKLGVG
jgi:exopolyphosphatase / guanosine-5'-triphosphate,3'-diphosphate pyrophosphatase